MMKIRTKLLIALFLLICAPHVSGMSAKIASKYGVYESEFVNEARQFRIPTTFKWSPDHDPKTIIDMNNSPQATNFKFSCPGHSLLTGVTSKVHKFSENNDKLSSLDRIFKFKCNFFEDEHGYLLMLVPNNTQSISVALDFGKDQKFDCPPNQYINVIHSDKYIDILKYKFVSKLDEFNEIKKYITTTFIESADLRQKIFVSAPLRNLKLTVKERFFGLRCSSIKSISSGVYTYGQRLKLKKTTARKSFNNLNCPDHYAMTSFRTFFESHLSYNDRTFEIVCHSLNVK